ncbi:ABC transporter substrate-binding protein [Brevibacterium otitidis]|uniref:ABC transporter substrate-binding protein n=1 Tax=Brevibacterium otitidis TaxID=53364 RepID=A0ABV5X046_9MICO|nr:siderophore ABC transporter substrate-binding protein CdtB [Brevibacterium otitidis]
MKLRTLALTALISSLALAGCGTTDDPRSAETHAAGGPVSITDSRGKEVTLDAPAERVVTLEWSVTEYVAALGVDPIGVADPEGYGQWGASMKLSGDPTDVGVRTEPSVDAIAGLEPDLILADVSSIPEDAMEQMERIAPVAVFTSATTDDLFELVKSNQHDVATLLGKEDEAAQLDEDFEQTLADAKAKVAEAGLEGAPMVFVYPLAEANSLTFRMHGPGSAPSAVGSAIGLTDAWSKRDDEEYGISTTDVEGLRELPDDTQFLYWDDPTQDSPISTLEKNSVWTGLPFVTAGNAAAAGDGIWIYGGTVSLGAFAENVADTITQK